MPHASIHFPPPTTRNVDLLIISGEHSGDQHAATLVRELLEQRPTLKISALGGPALRQTPGVHFLYDLAASSVVGFTEVLKNIFFFKDLFHETLRWIETNQPRVICFVDYPGFNLRLADALYKRKLSAKSGGHIKLLYYISPQIWAWKAGRRFKMARLLDGLGTLFPFEVDCYRDTSLKAEFVGHPFVAPGYQAPVHYDPQGPILLLPGSRVQSVSRIFPILVAAHREYGQRDALVLYPTDRIKKVLESVNPPGNIHLKKVGESSIGASAVLTSSGTMQFHCALAAIPGAITYRVNALTYFLGRRVVKIHYLGISNILLDEPMYPEYIQEKALPEALAAELKDCLDNPRRIERTREQAARLHKILAHPADNTAAGWLTKFL